jgi:hypothetical protein
MQRIVCGLSLMSKSIQATYYKISRGRMSIIVAKVLEEPNYKLVAKSRTAGINNDNYQKISKREIDRLLLRTTGVSNPTLSLDVRYRSHPIFLLLGAPCQYHGTPHLRF